MPGDRSADFYEWRETCPKPDLVLDTINLFHDDVTTRNCAKSNFERTGHDVLAPLKISASGNDLGSTLVRHSPMLALDAAMLATNPGAGVVQAGLHALQIHEELTHPDKTAATKQSSAIIGETFKLIAEGVAGGIAPTTLGRAVAAYEASSIRATEAQHVEAARHIDTLHVPVLIHASQSNHRRTSGHTAVPQDSPEAIRPSERPLTTTTGDRNTNSTCSGKTFWGNKKCP